MKCIRPKRKNYQKRIIEELEHKLALQEHKIKLLQGKMGRLDNKNIQLRNMSSKCNALFATFMYKCVIESKYPIDTKDALNRIYSLSQKMLEEIGENE